MKSLEESAGVILDSMFRVNDRGQQPARIVLGQVLTAGSPETLRIRCGGLELSRRDLQINPALLAEYDGGFGGTLTGTDSRGGSVTVEVEPGDLSRRGFGVDAGDLVVLATQDWQTFALICKVVSL